MPRVHPPPTEVPLPPAGDASLPRAARLVKPWGFKLVQEKGRTFDLGPLVFRFLDRARLPAGVRPATAAPGGSARLGLAVSRRVGNAVERNRVKRLVRETFRRRRRTLAGLDLVVTGRPAAALLDQPDVGALFDTLATKLGRARHPDDPVFTPPRPRPPPRPPAPPSAPWPIARPPDDDEAPPRAPPDDGPDGGGG